MRHTQWLAVHLPCQEDTLMETDVQGEGRIVLAL